MRGDGNVTRREFYAVRNEKGEYISLEGKWDAVPALYFDEGKANQDAARLGAVVDRVLVGESNETVTQAHVEAPAEDQSPEDRATPIRAAQARTLRMLEPLGERTHEELLDDLARWVKEMRSGERVRAIATIALCEGGGTAFHWDTGVTTHTDLIGGLSIAQRDLVGSLEEK